MSPQQQQQTSERPSLRALRASIANALGVDPWAVFAATRALTGLHHQPAPRAMAMMLVAILAHLNRGGEPAAQLPNRIERVASFKLYVPATARGRLPDALRYFELDMTLASILENLFVTLSTRAGLQAFVRPGGVVRPDAIGLSLYTGECAVLAVNTVLGKWEGQFGPPDARPFTPAPLYQRIGLNAGAMIELARLAAGDLSAEQRAGYFQQWNPLFVEGSQPADAPSPHNTPSPSPAETSPTRRSRRRRAAPGVVTDAEIMAREQIARDQRERDGRS